MNDRLTDKILQQVEDSLLEQKRHSLTIRQMVYERILFALSEEELREDYSLTPESLASLSDLDLFELYESLYCYD
jgi:hypothetical protein